MNYNIPVGATITHIDDEYTSPNNGRNGPLGGLKIETDRGNIILVIEEFQDCCEVWGSTFLETPDDLSKYIGAKILSISDTNDSFTDTFTDEDHEPRETQLKIATNKGVLQYAVYNNHNGYYGHATFLQVFDLEEDGRL